MDHLPHHSLRQRRRETYPGRRGAGSGCRRARPAAELDVPGVWHLRRGRRQSVRVGPLAGHSPKHLARLAGHLPVGGLHHAGGLRQHGVLDPHVRPVQAGGGPLGCSNPGQVHQP